MATNISYRSKGYDFISFRAWYNGNTSAEYCEFFIDGSEYETVYYPDGSGSDTNWTTPYIDATGLMPNTEYRIFARFRGAGGSVLGVTSVLSVRTNKMPTPISPPTRLNISTTHDSATLSWGGASGGIDYYEIYVDNYYWGQTTSTSYTATGLYPSTSYEFCVYAVNDLYVEGICRTARTKREPIPPTKPTVLNITNITDDSVRLSWSGATGDIDYYEIYVDNYYWGQTTSTSYNVTGLWEDTLYEFCVYAVNDYYGGDGICKTARTKPISPPTAPIITGRFDGGLELSWGTVSGTNQYTFQYKPSYLSTWTSRTTSNSHITISGLSYAVKYDFRAKSDKNDLWSSINSGHTSPKKPTITATNITYHSIAIKVNALPDNCDRVIVECYVYSNGNYIYETEKIIDPPGRTFSSAQTITFTGLNRNWPYRFFALSQYDANGDGTGTGTWIDSEVAGPITAITLNRPDDWQWQTNFQVGMEFTVNYSSSLGNYIYLMPASEWNNFLERINEFRDYANIPRKNFTSYARNTELTSSVYNVAVNAINDMRNFFGSGYSNIPTKSSNSELTKADLDRLKNTLNSID